MATTGTSTDTSTTSGSGSGSGTATGSGSGSGIATGTDNLSQLASIIPQILVDQLLQSTKNCALVWNATTLTQFQTSFTIGNSGYQIYLSKILNGDGTIDYNLDVLTNTFQSKYFTNSDSQPDLIELYKIIDRALNVNTPGNRMKEFLQSFGTPNCVPVNMIREDTIPIADAGVLGEGGALTGQAYLVTPSGGALGFGQAAITHATIDIGSGGIVGDGEAILSGDEVLAGGSAIVTTVWGLIGSGGIVGNGDGIVNMPMGLVANGVAQVTLLSGPLSFFKPRSDGFASPNLYLFSTRTGRQITNESLSQGAGVAPYYFLPGFPPQETFVSSQPTGQFALNQDTGDLFVINETWAIPFSNYQNQVSGVISYSHAINLYQIQRQGNVLSNQLVVVDGSTNSPPQLTMMISIDDINQIIYMLQAWSETSFQLWSCNYDGTNLQALTQVAVHPLATNPDVLGPGNYIIGFEVDPTRQCCYWIENIVLTNSNYEGSSDTTNTSQFFVGRLSLADYSQSYIYSNSTGAASAMSLDRGNQRIYVSFAANQSSTQAQTASGTLVVDLTGGSTMLAVLSTDVSVDENGTEVYSIVIAPEGRGQITQMPIVGGIANPLQIATLQNLPDSAGPLQHAYPPFSESLIQPTRQFYFLHTSDSSSSYNGAAKIYVLNADNTATSLIGCQPSNLPDNPGTVGDVRTIVTYEGKIYFTSHGMVYSVNTDGSGLTHLTTLNDSNPGGVTGPFAGDLYFKFPDQGPAITIDTINNVLYIAGSSIWKCNLDGTNTQQLTTGNLGGEIKRLVIDPINQNIFWILNTDANVYWSPLNDIQANILAEVLDNDFIHGLDIDVTNRKLYWSAGNLELTFINSSIYTVDISNPETLNLFSPTLYFTIQPLEAGYNDLYTDDLFCPISDMKIDAPNNRAYFLGGGTTFIQTDLTGRNLTVYFVQDATTDNLLQIVGMTS